MGAPPLVGQLEEAMLFPKRGLVEKMLTDKALALYDPISLEVDDCPKSLPGVILEHNWA